MSEYAKLVISVDSSQVGQADLGLAKLGRTAVGVAASIGLVTSASSAIRSAVGTISNFEQSMSRVEAITRASADEMRGLTAVARELGATTEFSASQAADGLQFLGMAGFTAAQSIQAIPDVLSLATAASLDLGRAADIASNVMSGFGISADNASRVTDVLAASSSRANTDVNQLGDAISYVGPVAAAMGVDVGDAAAAIGVLSDAGIQGSSAGTGLRRVLSSLANPTRQAQAVLERLGVSLSDVNPQTNDLVDVIQTLSKAGIDAADALTIFGDRGGPALLALVENNPRLAEMTDVLSDVSGEAKRMADTMQDNLTGDLKSMWSAVEELTLALNEESGLGGGLRTATQAATEFFRAMSAGVSDGSLKAFTDDLDNLLGLTSRVERDAKTLAKIGELFFSLQTSIGGTLLREGALAAGIYGQNLDLIEEKIARVQKRLEGANTASLRNQSNRRLLAELQEMRALEMAVQGDMEARISLYVSLNQELEGIGSRLADLSESRGLAARREAGHLTERQEEILAMLGRINTGMMTQEQIIESLGGAIDGWRSPMQRVNDEVTLMSERVENLRIVTASSNPEIERLVSGLEAEHRQLTMTGSELVEYAVKTALGEDANKTGARSIIDAAVALHQQNEALKESKRATDAARTSVEQMLAAEERAANARQSTMDAARVQSDVLRRQVDVLGRGKTAQEALNRALYIENQLRTEAYRNLLPHQQEEYRKLIEQQYDLRYELEENQHATNEWAQWTESALERVDSAFADAWRNISDGFSSFRDNLTNAFKQMLAELAHLAITRPIILQLGAAMGIGPGTQGNNGIWGSSSSGGGIGDMFTMAGIGKLAQTGWSGIKGLATGQGLSGFGGMFASQITSPVLSEAAFSQIALEQGLAAAYAADIGAGAGTSMAASFKSGIADVLSTLKGAATNPVTWIMAGMLASNQLYSSGVRADGGAIRDRFEGSGTGGKILGGALGLTGDLTKWADKAMDPLGVFGRAVPILSGSPVTQAINMTLGRLFGGGEQFKRTVGSAQGVYAGGEYTGMGAIESFYGGSRRFGDDFDAALHDMNAMFTAQLGGLFDVFGLESDITTEATARLRRTSGRLVGSLTASFEDAVINVSGQYAKKGRIEEGMQQFFDEVMGKGFVEAIAASSLPEYLKELTVGLTDAEEVGVTISGLLQRFGGVNDVLSTISIALLDTSDAGLRAADSILALMGGIDSLAGSASVYRDRFFSEAEKMELTISSVARTFDEAGVVLATSREGYREMVDSIDLTTEAGRRMFATLMTLAGEADAYYSALEARSAQMLGAVGAAFSSLQRSIAAQQQRARDAYAARIGSLNDMASTASANINEMVRVSNALNTAMRRLRGTSDETVRSLQAQAVMRLNSILMSGRPLSQFDDLQDALDTASKVDPALYASLEEFERTQGRTANLIARLEEINGKQLSTEERLLNAVQAQIRAAEQQHERQMSALSMQLSYAQAQLDALNGLDSTIMGVTQAVNAMNAAMVGALKSMPSGSAKANTPANNKTIVDTLYETILGREADDGGRVYWQYQLQSGALDYSNVSETLARAAIENPDETQASKQNAREFLRNQGVPGFALGGDHLGGLRIVGERGPELEATGPSRIYNARQTAEMLGGGAQAAQEIAQLRKAVERQGDALRSIAKHTMQTARRVEFLERWDYDGMPEERKLA